MINDILNDGESRMKGAIAALQDELDGIRTGRATPALVEKLTVEYYGLTEDRRKDLAKQVSTRLEESRVAIRNVRRDIIKDLKDAEKEKLITEDERKKGEEKIQKLTDTWTAKVDEVGKKKEKEIMEV